MIQRETVELNQEVMAHLVPEGIPLRLKEGTKAIVTQALGGDVTVFVDGNLMQIFARDAHALGEKFRHSLPDDDRDEPLETRVWNRLKTCYDPEIPVNIVDLGLVYDCKIYETDEGKTRVWVQMTLTAPACGMGPILSESARQRILDIEGVDEAEVEIVFDPPWSREMMSEAAKLETGLL